MTSAAEERLAQMAKEANLSEDSQEFAEYLDAKDPLASFRSLFNYPKIKHFPFVDESLKESEEDCVYLCGNSLGLQPKRTKEIVNEELDKWAQRAVVGHHDDSARPWVDISGLCVEASAKIIGANPSEVVIMNSLTVNLHLLMVSFYKPTPKRHKIIIEAKAFPSDHFAVESQIKFHGHKLEDSLVLATPREGESTLRTEDILSLIEKHGDELSLLMLSGVQYYTGQFFDIKRLTSAAQAKGACVGFDLAHAVGNVPLQLHAWNVDFACWCTYKYLNSGPGGIAGAFVHEKHATDSSLPFFAGWWSHNPKTRFEMKTEFDPTIGASKYQLSNPPVLQMVSLYASLEIFDQTSMKALRDKSVLLTGYLSRMLQRNIINGSSVDGKHLLEIITPNDPEQRGCQLSLQFRDLIKPVFLQLGQRGIVCDKREPDVLRVSPVPLYNSFKDVFRFVKALSCVLKTAPK